MSMYGRVVLPYVLALVTGALMAWWLVTSLLSDSLTQRLEDQLERAVAELAAGRLPLSEDLLDRVGHLLGAELALLPATPSADDPGPSPLTTAALRVLGESPDGGASRIHRSGAPYSLVVRPIRAGVDPRYRALAAGTALTEVQQSSRRIAALLGAGVLTGTLLLAWAGHRAARAITVPITTLSELAARLATGDLRARVPVTGAPELVALGTSIERMADHLADYQSRLLEANRLSALGELAARVAHEIRNPLTAIKLHAELLRESTRDPAEHRSLDAISG